MLKVRKQVGAFFDQFGAWLLMIAVIFATLWIVEGTQSFHDCVKTEYAANGQNNSDERMPNVLDAALWDCMGPFITSNGDAITAAMTFFLFIATATLGWIGYKQGATSRAQLRAYLSVVIGGAIEQDRANGIRFEGNPTLKNRGQTPAYRVRYVAKADIIPDTLVENYHFVVDVRKIISEATIGPNEERILSGVVQNFVSDAEIPAIKVGAGSALWVWGTILYDDVFGRPHFVNFCQRLTWRANGQIFGIYSPRFANSN